MLKKKKYLTQKLDCLLLITGAFHSDGGIAAVNRLVIRALAEKGASLNILALLEKDATIDPRYTSSAFKVRYRTFSGNKFAFSISAWRTILSNHYTYIFVDHVNLASILAPLAWTKLCRYIVWLFGIEVFAPNPNFEGRLGLQAAWKRIAISEFTKSSVISRFPKLTADVCTLSLDPIIHPTDISLDHADNHQPIVLKAIDGSQSMLESRVILNVARMVKGERYKGQDSLIQAFPKVYEQFPNAQLVLAGQGDDMARLKALTRTLPLAIQARIFLPGYVPDDLLNRMYQLCYVFAMPSIGEGFGLVFLEAMTWGKPCIGAKSCATPDVISDNVSGILVDDAKSADEISNALLFLLSNPDIADKMGRAGINIVYSKYRFENFREGFWKVLASE